MARALRILAIALIVLVLVLVSAVFAATRLIDPNSFKPQIEALALEHGNLDLDIQGDLGWRFWPSVGLDIGRVEARIHEEEDLLAALDEASLGVRVWPLLFRRVEMDEVQLDGLHLELLEDERGGNWERLGPRDEDAAPEPEDTVEAAVADTDEEAETLTVPVRIPQVTIRNGQVRYRNIIDETDIHLDRFALVARNVQPEEPFAVESSLRYRDGEDLTAELALETMLGLDLDTQVFTLDPLELSTRVAGLTPLPLRAHASVRVQAALGDEQVNMEDLVLRAAGTRTTGALALKGFERPAFSGTLATDPFDLNAVLSELGEEPVVTSDEQALSRVALEAGLNGPAGGLMLEPLTLRLDDSTIEGRAGVKDLETLALRFDLDLDHITLDGYLPPPSEPEDRDDDTPDAETKELSDEPLLPLEALRELGLQGRFGIGELRHDGIEMRNLETRVQASDGMLALEKADGAVLDGTLAARARLDVRTDTPELALTAEADGLHIRPVMLMLLEQDLFYGTLGLDTAITASGNSERALMESAAGHFDFNLKDGTVRGMNLHNVLIGGLNEMLERYEALTAFMDDLDDDRLPRELREDTEIIELTGRSRLENRRAEVTELNAELRRGATLEGNGWLDLPTDDFEFSLRMRAPHISDNPRIAGRDWPIRCAGNLAGNPAQWCLPRREAIRSAGRELVEQLVRQEAAERLGVDPDEAEEKLRERGEEALDDLRERARDEIRGLFR